MSDLVPVGWHITNISNVCHVLDSYRIPINSTDRSTRKGIYPYYGANGVQGYIDDYIFDGEHVLLAEDGGHFGEWDSRPISYLVSGKFWVNNHAHILRAKEGYSTRFIHYGLVHKNILKYINGGTRSKLNQADMREIEVLAPPEDEQQKIATILSSVDDVIEKTRAQIDKLKDLKTGMMQELLTQGIGHTEFKDSAVGRIPETWSVVKLQEVVRHFQNGYAFPATGYSESGIPIISMAWIGLDGKFKKEHSKVKYWDSDDYESLQRYAVSDGDLLIAMTDVTPGMDLIGRCCLANISRKSLLNQRVGLIRVDPSKLDKLFFSYYSNHEDWRSYCKTVSGLAAQANIGKQQILDAVIPIPPIEEQKVISKRLEALDSYVNQKEAKVAQLCLLKTALMQDLLTGKVRVNINQKESEVA